MQPQELPSPEIPTVSCADGPTSLVEGGEAPLIGAQSQVSVNVDDPNSFEAGESQPQLRLPYDIEMCVRYLLITFEDPQNNVPPSIMAGVMATAGILVLQFTMLKTLAEYPKWQSEQVYPFFTTLNLILWYTVYFLLDSDEPINFDWIDDI